jgi:hypothetical protein
MTSSDPLNRALANVGVEAVEPVFPNARQPGKRIRVKSIHLDSAEKPPSRSNVDALDISYRNAPQSEQNSSWRVEKGEEIIF